MNNLISTHFLAATGYSCDAYGANAYGECSTASTSDPASNNNLLANTGFDVLLPLALGLSILIASVILLVKKVRRHKQHN
jgi:LPXTG-motif cell wall-anchored protein